MTKRNKIIYWVATGWLSLGMVSTGIVQLIKMKEEVDMMTRLGYPIYFLTLIGVWKLLGVVAVLIPKFPLLKEWAYAGFFFAMSGAVFSHIAVGDDAKELFGPVLLLVLTAISWYFRPAARNLPTEKSFQLINE
ncbi:DoxX family protein [Dyadobacter diqingensis]|uniref:DoxX family protein n=1 Tax=Dyadobacter diqingensis TaxID=2938121 RepID=UPI0020C18F4E|nr:DoxX family protein [Dyadobacter diqingensis]